MNFKLPSIKVGDFIEEGQTIGVIVPVLKKDKGNGCTMLHLELYKSGTRNHVTWFLDKDKPDELLNPIDLLKKIKEFCDEK